MKTYEQYLKEINSKYTFKPFETDLGYLHSRHLQGDIDLNLECQRDYVWPEEFQQELWDTILNDDRIPELHAIREERIFRFMDGKQRLTTLWGILENRIPLILKGKNSRIRDENFIKYALKDFKNEKVTKVYFKDLNESCQGHILNTPITIATYSNVSEEDLVKLFRKLNTAEGLSAFLKAISRNILVRRYFTQHLIDHPVFHWMQEVEKKKDRSEITETMLVRMIFLNQFGPICLSPKHLGDNMENIDTELLKEDLNEFKRVLDLFDQDTIKYLTKNWRAHETYFPIVFYLIKKYPVSTEHIRKIFLGKDILEFVTTQHANLEKKEILQRIDGLTYFIEEKLKTLDSQA